MEHERERQAREEEESLIQRQKEAAEFKQWGMQEDIFHLEQAALRSKIRIKDGRGEIRKKNFYFPNFTLC